MAFLFIHSRISHIQLLFSLYIFFNFNKKNLHLNILKKTHSNRLVVKITSILMGNTYKSTFMMPFMVDKLLTTNRNPASFIAKDLDFSIEIYYVVLFYVKIDLSCIKCIFFSELMYYRASIYYCFSCGRINRTFQRIFIFKFPI